MKGFEITGTTLKALFAAAAAIAIGVGLLLPVPHRAEARVQAQLAPFELGRP
jgi:hypothetical protein